MNFSRLVQQDTSVIGSVIGSVVVPRAIVSFNLMYFESCFNNFSFFLSLVFIFHLIGTFGICENHGFGLSRIIVSDTAIYTT